MADRFMVDGHRTAISMSTWFVALLIASSITLPEPGFLRVLVVENTSFAPLPNAEVIDLDVSLGVGTGSARAYGCDLTKGYIDENAAYYSS